MKREEGGTPSLSTDVESSIASQRGSGRSLPEVEQSFFGSRFGYDFSGVRVHADREAGRLTESVQAKAFTVGQDVFFGQGEYSPGLSEGRKLLAHELTHVLQQTGRQDHATELLEERSAEGYESQDVRMFARRSHAMNERRSDVFPLMQREPLGRGGGARKKHIVEPGESLSLLAGYPNDGWQERLDQLIAANSEYPSIKNRTPDDPKYGWLEKGDTIYIPVKLAPVIDPGEVTCPPCRSDWATIVHDDHNRAMGMLDTAISKMALYDGTNPTDVRDALERRFKESSSAFAAWINLNLRLLKLLAPLSGYLCQKVYYDCGGTCQKMGTTAWVPFCLPLSYIRVCDDRYFNLSDRMRSMVLIHEWVHKYGCNFDFGYCSGSDCPGGTTRSLFNADPWARLVLDIG